MLKNCRQLFAVECFITTGVAVKVFVVEPGRGVLPPREAHNFGLSTPAQSFHFTYLSSTLLALFLCSALCTQADAANAKVFVVEPAEGVLQPGEALDFRITFLPYDRRRFERWAVLRVDRTVPGQAPQGCDVTVLEVSRWSINSAILFHRLWSLMSIFEKL